MLPILTHVPARATWRARLLGMHTEPSDMQRLVDRVFHNARQATRLDVVLCAEALDLNDSVLAIVALLPPGHYTRRRLSDQLNSAITAHGYGSIMGTVD